MLGPGWEGGQNSVCTVCLSGVGHISLAASETYSQAGCYKINGTRSSLTHHALWCVSAAHHPFTAIKALTPGFATWPWLSSWGSALTVGCHTSLCVHSQSRGKEKRRKISAKLLLGRWRSISCKSWERYIANPADCECGQQQIMNHIVITSRCPLTTDCNHSTMLTHSTATKHSWDESELMMCSCHVIEYAFFHIVEILCMVVRCSVWVEQFVECRVKGTISVVTDADLKFLCF